MKSPARAEGLGLHAVLQHPRASDWGVGAGFQPHCPCCRPTVSDSHCERPGSVLEVPPDRDDCTGVKTSAPTYPRGATPVTTLSWDRLSLPKERSGVGRHSCMAHPGRKLFC